MGILDDAIREHLELKRAHGASEDEVARKEAEVFGLAQQEQGADETTVATPEFAERPEPAEPPEFADAAPAEPDPGPAPVFPAAERPAPVEEPVEEPPVEEPPVEEPPPAEAEDVLEETPEFLQDTPEHDRLWFEQKPPRDFDFGS